MRVPTRAVLALLLIGSGGCERMTSAVEDRAQRVAEQLSVPHDANPPGPELTADEQLERKLQLYVECRRRASSRIRDSWRRYDERVGDSGLPRAKGVTPYLYKIDSELTPCEQATTRGPTLAPPAPALERAMSEYLEHGRAFAALSVELDTYYEREGFSADGWAKSKTLAPSLAAAFAAWDAADRALHERIRTRREQLDRRRIAQVERREGRNEQWHARSFMLTAEAFWRCIEADDATAPGCKDAHEALTQARIGLREYCEAHEDRAAAVFWMGAFRQAATEYQERSDEHMKALRKGKPGATRPPLARAYDMLRSDSHNLRYAR